MFAIFATTFVTAFGIGHFDRSGNIPNMSTQNIVGHKIAVDLPPRTELSDLSICHFLFGAQVPGKKASWNFDHTLQRFGSVTFDGANFYNNSHTKWFVVKARIENVC